MKFVWNVPNAMTAFRLLLSAPLAWFIATGNATSALFVFGLGVLSDADGTVARLLGQTTKFGELFDILADTVFITAGLIPLLVMQKLSFLLLLFLLLANMPRFVMVRLDMKRKGKTGSTFMSKTSGMLTFFILPFGILGSAHTHLYTGFVVVFTAFVMGHKMMKR